MKTPSPSERDIVQYLLVLQEWRTDRARHCMVSGLVSYLRLFRFLVVYALYSIHDSYKAWREGDHDDMVLSSAVALWYAEKKHRPPSRRYYSLN